MWSSEEAVHLAAPRGIGVLVTIIVRALLVILVLVAALLPEATPLVPRVVWALLLLIGAVFFMPSSPIAEPPTRRAGFR